MKTNKLSEDTIKLRETNHLLQSELAQLLGTSTVFINRLEHGYQSPSPKVAKEIASLISQSRQGLPFPKSNKVLQNGSFASRGSTRGTLHALQPDPLSPTLPIGLSKTPMAPILSRLKTGKFFGEGKNELRSIIKLHEHSTITATHASSSCISAGKNTYTYDAHTYHTKVPPQGIVEFIQHYLPEGGLVFDPFAGSGMTGVAALVAGVDVILNELSPAACFISHNYTESVSPFRFAAATKAVLSSLEDVRRTLYTTTCRECGENTEILYTVWSYYVLCPHCKAEFRLWDYCRKYGQTVKEHKILSKFPCPNCGTTLKKGQLVRTKTEPVMLGYKCCSRVQIEHPLTKEDLKLVNSIEYTPLLAEGFYPQILLPEGVNLNQPKRHGLTTIDSLYTGRNLSAMSQLWREIHRLEDTQLASIIAFVFTSLYKRVTRLSEFRFWGGSGNTANYNVPHIFNEANVFLTFERKAASIFDHLETTAANYEGKRTIVCNSATSLDYLPDESIDFIFTDPPFGANINYSDMNLLWESWLDELTDQTYEAIINRVQGKGLNEYENLITRSLRECFRVLKVGHWMLLVFMNSSSKVWDSLKASVTQAGFVLMQVDVFDKQHGTFKQFVSENTAGCDLVLHCQKPISTNNTIQMAQTQKARDSITHFIIKRSENLPINTFLHVPRESEIDFRTLYSEWMASGLLRGCELEDFSTFRKIAQEILDSLKEKKDDTGL